MELKYPVTDHKISQDFGIVNTEGAFYTVFDNKHPGVDFAVEEGAPIFAAYDGIVVRKEEHKGMGNVLATRFGNVVILYAHLSSYGDIKLGDIVTTGQNIATSGNTGLATTGPHLHFELRDLTKKELKDMVFKPDFEKDLKNIKNEFEYVVNNKNTPKTLRSLSQKYFGSDAYCDVILNVNKTLDENPESVIEDGMKVTIPNYK